MTNHYPYINYTQYTEEEGHMGDCMHACVCVYRGGNNQLYCSYASH